LRQTLIFVIRIAVGCVLISIATNCGLEHGIQRRGNSAPTRTSTPNTRQKTLDEGSPQTKRDVSRLGFTRLKTPITAFIFGNGSRHVIVLGGIHGDEPSSRDVAEAFVSSLNHWPVPSDMTIVVVPAANPDGIALRTRSNSSDVDINRNFPSSSWRAKSRGSRYAPGKEPGSELETKAILTLLDDLNPMLLISIHAPLNCINWDGQASDVARAMSQASGLPLKSDIGYETPGSLGSYAGKERDIPTITLELESAVTRDEVVRNGLLALQAAITYLQRQPTVIHKASVQAAKTFHLPNRGTQSALFPKLKVHLS